MRRLSDLAIAVKLTLAFASLLVVIATVGGTTYLKLGFLEESSAWTTHTYKVLETANALTTAMVNQETGVRGYLISG